MTAGALVVSLHDVAPADLRALRRGAELLADRGVPTTALVVCAPVALAPRPARHEIAGFLDEVAQHGGEIAVHGWSHRAEPLASGVRNLVGRVAARGCEELWCADEHSAAQRVAACIAVLRDLGHEPLGITPPGWLAGPDARRAIAVSGLRYRTDHLAVHDLVTGRAHRAPAWSHRPGSRLTGVGGVVYGSGAAATAAVGATVRLALHPADLEDERLLRRSLATIDRLLDSGLDPRTYASLVNPESVAA